MFCKNCGKKVEVTGRFCGACGTAINEQPTASVESIATQQPISTTSTTKKHSNKMIGLIACLVLVLGVAIVIFFIFSPGNPERILERYIEAGITGNFRTISRYSVIDFDTLASEMHESQGMSAREFSDALYEEFGVTSVEELFADMLEEEAAGIERQFGSDFRISVEIIDSFSVSRRERENIISELEWIFDQLGMDISNIISLDGSIEMVEYEVEITISGRRDEDTVSMSVIMIRANRSWRVLDEYFIQELRRILRR